MLNWVGDSGKLVRLATIYVQLYTTRVQQVTVPVTLLELSERSLNLVNKSERRQPKLQPEQYWKRFLVSGFVLIL